MGSGFSSAMIQMCGILWSPLLLRGCKPSRCSVSVMIIFLKGYIQESLGAAAGKQLKKKFFL